MRHKWRQYASEGKGRAAVDELGAQQNPVRAVMLLGVLCVVLCVAATRPACRNCLMNTVSCLQR